MKKLIFLCLVSIISATSIFAIPEPGASEKILKLFHNEFPKVEKPVFYDYGNSYMVYFKKDDYSSGRVYYNLDGEMTETIKYYTESELEPFIRAKVNKKYKGKTIFGVTEVVTNNEHFYQIVLQDNKMWYTVKSDATGSMSIEKKLRKT